MYGPNQREMLSKTAQQLSDLAIADERTHLHLLPFTVQELITRLKVSAEIIEGRNPPLPTIVEGQK